MGKPSIKHEGPGVHSVKVSSFEELHAVLNELHGMPPAADTRPRAFIFRGQRQGWPLVSRLARHGATTCAKERDQLKRYRLATRGQMDRLISGSEDEDKDELWAIGQHHGLATPFLDWTEAPFVALFFAFHEPPPDRGSEGCRTVYAFHWRALEGEQPLPNGGDPPKLVSVITPERSRNERMVVQQGVFLKPLQRGRDIEGLVKEAYAGQASQYVCLSKITFAETFARDEVLRRLKSMNITYRTLFPDLEGAAKHSNLALGIDDY